MFALWFFLNAHLVLSSVSGAVVCFFIGWWGKWKSSSGEEAWNKLIFLLEPYGSSEIPYLQQPIKWLSSYIQGVKPFHCHHFMLNSFKVLSKL